MTRCVMPTRARLQPTQTRRIMSTHAMSENMHPMPTCDHFKEKDVSCPHVLMSNRSHVFHIVSCPHALMYNPPKKNVGDQWAPLSIIKEKACRARTCSCQAKATSRRVMPAGSPQKKRWRSVGMAHICSNIACGGAHRHGTPCLCWL